MRFKTRPKVALLVESSRTYGRDVLQGIALFARTQSNWVLLHQEMLIDAALPEWLGASKVDGVIARVHGHTIDDLRKLQVPVVDVLCHRPFRNLPRVETDDHKVAKLAFEHLWDRGFRRFAYCGFESAHYSTNRLRSFHELVAASSCPFSVFATPSQVKATLTSVEQSWLADAKPVSDWLATLEPPTGLFACNDICGQQVLSACRMLGVSVPDDIGVIGVDDDNTICSLSDPPLSSVNPDARHVGYRAAEVLKAMMNGKSVATAIHYVQPKCVVQRLSTQVEAIDDREVAQVCRYIRQHACDGIDVSDVVKNSPLSRRQLERRFRKLLNRTLHDEITRIQMLKVKQLLRKTTLTLEQIAPIAGFSHRERLSSVFKRETGETPGTYRRSNILVKSN